MTTIPFKLRRVLDRIILGASVFLLIAVSLSGAALADNYGSGDYGTCPYQDCTPATQTTLPGSGLQININLQNGQVIPSSGYTIIVTPLNGKGTSFKQVTFTIDGKLVQTVLPAEDGTAQWSWNPQEFPGTTISITVTGTDGETVTQTFTVTIGSSPTPSTATQTTTTGKGGNPTFIQQVGALPGKAIQNTEHVLRALPKRIKHSIPYFLFVLLCLDILLAFLQTRREIKQVRHLADLLTREKEIGQLKSGFTELTSHYLRTPLTTITGALELMTSLGGAVTPQTIQALQANTAQLRAKTEELVNATSNSPGATITVASSGPPLNVWRRPLFYLPVVAVGVVVFWFDYLAQHAGAFSVGQTELATQAVIFGSIALLMYQVLRRLQLHRQANSKARYLLEQEQAFNRGREELIARIGMELSGTLASLSQNITQMPLSKASEIMLKGQNQLQNTIDKLTIATRLKGTHSLQPYASTDLQSTFDIAMHGISDNATAKNIQVKLLHNLSFPTQNPDLLAIALHTIIDNALAYSPPQATVEIDAQLVGATVKISVVDHGSGIPEDKKFGLFQAFSKTEGVEAFNHEGMGFSLYLDKLIMNYLVGDISITSTPGTGTTVFLSLPTGQ